MHSLARFARFVGVLFGLLLTFAGLGWSLGSAGGAAIGVGVAAAALLGLAFRAERILVRCHLGSRPAPGVLRSLLQSTAASEGIHRVPALFVLETPFANAVVLRSPGSAGTLLVTQGLLTLLDDRELRWILMLLLRRSRETGLPARTFAACLALYLFRLAPPAWVRLIFTGEARGPKNEPVFLTPSSAMGFLAVFPLAWSLLGGGRLPRHYGDTGQEVVSAMQKVARASGSTGPEDVPAAASLYLVNPWRDRMLLPFSSGER